MGARGTAKGKPGFAFKPLPSPVGVHLPGWAVPCAQAGMDPVPGAEELVVPQQREGAGPELLRVMHLSFTAVGDAGEGCPPSGGNFSQRQREILTPIHYFKGFSLSEDNS